MTDTYWRCLTCEAHGTTTGTESGADAKHARAEQHAKTTTTRAEWARDGRTGE